MLMDWLLLVSFLGVFAVGCYAGYRVNDHLFRTTFSEMLAQAGVTDQQLDQFVDHWEPVLGSAEPEAVLPKLQIRIEQIDNMIYCYEKSSGLFLAQARTRDELIDALTERLGPVSLLVQPEDGAEYVKD
jgi:hypothetical protein